MEAGADTKLTTAEQREQFERDGYFIIEDLGLPPEVFDGAAADFVPLLLEEEDAEVWGDDGVFYTSHRIMDAWKISENIKAIATAPRVLGILEELYGRKPLPFQTLNFKMPTQQRAHSDTIHFNSKPAGFMAGVWVALEDMDMDNGPLFYHPGSQKLPEVTMEDVGVEADHSQYLALRGVHADGRPGQRPADRLRPDQEGPGADLVREPAARRRRRRRTRTARARAR